MSKGLWILWNTNPNGCQYPLIKYFTWAVLCLLINLFVLAVKLLTLSWYMLSLIWVRTVSAWLLVLELTLFPLLVRVFKTGGAEPFRTFEILSMIWFLIFLAPSYFFYIFSCTFFCLVICIRSLSLLSAALSKWCLAECPFWLCWCSVGF